MAVPRNKSRIGKALSFHRPEDALHMHWELRERGSLGTFCRWELTTFTSIHTTGGTWAGVAVDFQGNLSLR